MVTKPAFSYMLVMGLYTAAKDLFLNIDLPDDHRMLALKSAIQAVDDDWAEAQMFQAEIQAARDTYAMGSDDNVEIDDHPMLSVADEGVWVSAWVWVPREDVT